MIKSVGKTADHPAGSESDSKFGIKQENRFQFLEQKASIKTMQNSRTTAYGRNITQAHLVLSSARKLLGLKNAVNSGRLVARSACSARMLLGPI